MKNGTCVVYLLSKKEKVYYRLQLGSIQNQENVLRNDFLLFYDYIIHHTVHRFALSNRARIMFTHQIMKHAPLEMKLIF